MAGWVAVRDEVPWLPLPPYLIQTVDGARLRASLRNAGFEVFDADAETCADERALLLTVGDALGFPDYYGANWAAFEDCLGDLMRDGAGRVALVLHGADTLMREDLHAFVRSVHLLLEAVVEVERAQPENFQFEVFLVGDFIVGAEP